MVPDLIFDVGMHEAGDTEFYLKKGFRVVAFEANPILCARVKERLKVFVDAGRLHVMNVGISEKAGTENFLINHEWTDWSSFFPHFANRTGNPESFPIECRRLDYFLDIFGTPYYLKVDIEGYDYTCIDALKGRSDLPKFVSAEATFEFAASMSPLGYRKFKLINQCTHQRTPMRAPAREGAFVEQVFTGHHSGPFGDETPGEWLTADQLADELARLKNHGFHGSAHEAAGGTEEEFYTGWWDFHASLA